MVRHSAVIQSMGFHVAVVAAFAVSIPYLSRDIAPEQPILTVEIVDIAPETNLDEGTDTAIEPEVQDETEKPPEVEQPEAPPPAPAQRPPPTPESVPSEDLETAEAEPVPSLESKPVQAPQKRPINESPEFKELQEKQAQLTSKLQDLTERQAQQKRENEEKDEEAAELKEAQEELDQLVGQALNAPPKTSSTLSVSQTDILRNHIGICWNPPAGASGADALIVDIIVRLNESADVVSVVIVDEARVNSDRTFRAAANAASRAIIDCSPLPLPLDEYESWRELQFEFNPRFITRR
jgi:hypothetical protein